jgi:preprotein translocase subunit SecD
LGQKTVKASINKGFKEAVKPTIVLNVVAGIVALALLAFTQGLIQSFAITFGIGAVLSIISGLAFTRMFSSLIMPLVKDKEKFIGVAKNNAPVKEEA